MNSLFSWYIDRQVMTPMNVLHFMYAPSVITAEEYSTYEGEDIR